MQVLEREMASEKADSKRICARAFVLSVSLVSSAAVWMTVVKALRYTVICGFFYFMGYFAAMALFLESLGYSLFRRKEQ